MNNHEKLLRDELLAKCLKEDIKNISSTISQRQVHYDIIYSNPQLNGYYAMEKAMLEGKREQMVEELKKVEKRIS